MQSLYLPDLDVFVRWHMIGSGPKIIYLPGLSFPAVGNFLALASDPLMYGTTGVMIDYPGSGASDHPTDFSYTLSAHAGAIAAVLDHLDCGAVPVVGHSMGGSVAIQLALERPDLVARLVVAEGNLTPGGGLATRHFASFTEAEFIATGMPAKLAAKRSEPVAGDHFSGFLYAAWSQADPRGIHGNSMALVDLPDDFADRFLTLDIPRAFFFGEHSVPGGSRPAGPDAPDVDFLRAAGVAVGIVPGTGHEMMLRNPGGFAQILIDELAR